MHRPHPAQDRTHLARYKVRHGWYSKSRTPAETTKKFRFFSIHTKRHEILCTCSVRMTPPTPRQDRLLMHVRTWCTCLLVFLSCEGVESEGANVEQQRAWAKRCTRVRYGKITCYLYIGNQRSGLSPGGLSQ